MSNKTVSDHRDDSDAGMIPDYLPEPKWHSFTAPTYRHRDCMAPEYYWYAGRKVEICWDGNVPDELAGKAFDELYEGKLGTLSIEYEGQKVLIRISE